MMRCRSSLGSRPRVIGLAFLLAAAMFIWPSREAYADGPAQPPDDPTTKTWGAELRRAYDKMAAAIKPQPLPQIPDDPPPHEGKMFDLPYVVEPPDFVLVEVLEALPGRPISGTRLVRPDGTITLGFYGDIHVRGLTPTQIRAKIALHLLSFLDPEIVGLVAQNDDGGDVAPAPGDVMPPMPPREPAQPEADVFPPIPVLGEISIVERLPKLEGARRIAVPAREEPQVLKNTAPRSVRPEAEKEEGVFCVPVAPPQKQPLSARTQPSTARRVSLAEPDEPAPPSARVITAQLRSQPDRSDEAKAAAKEKPVVPQAPKRDRSAANQPDAEKPVAPAQKRSDLPKLPEGYRHVAPEQTTRVYVDVDSYNSKHYYVYGDIPMPGRYPCTGKDTVLDAIGFAGGILPTAGPKDVVLVRPAQGSKPAREYRIDWEAIVRHGDKTANLQIFPDDRLVIGRTSLPR